MTEILSSRWDWYELTIDNVDDGRIPSSLALALGAKTEIGKPRNGYASCVVIARNDVVLAEVFSGSNRIGEVHVTITSDACDEVVPLVRNLWPVHRVSRADVACDFQSEFSSLDEFVMSALEPKGISHRLITSSDGGATRYFGAVSSETRLRIYKKTEQMRAMHPDQAAEIPDGIVRLELQHRPSKRAAKAHLSTLQPDEVWGVSKWASLVAEMVLGFKPERAPTHFRKPTDWTRSLHFLGVQYGPSFQRRSAEVGEAQATEELLLAIGKK